MDIENNNYPFPQANDFDKIIKIILIEDESNIFNIDFLKQYLCLGTDRQISYYISACQFLDILDSSKQFTKFGYTLRNSIYENLVIQLSKKIVSLPVFGDVFFQKYLFKQDIEIDTISQLISDIYNISNYEVCKRRSSTVRKWIDWIEEQSN